MKNKSLPEFRPHPLSQQHKWDRFSCGDPFIDRFHLNLEQRPPQNRMLYTWVLANPMNQRVHGFVAISFLNGSIGAVNFEFLAVDRPFQNKGLGTQLARHAFKEIYHAQKLMPVFSVAVQMSPTLGREADLRRFYMRLGVEEAMFRENFIILPFASVAKLAGMDAGAPARQRMSA